MAFRMTSATMVECVFLVNSFAYSSAPGLELARLADLPSDVIVEGKRVSHRLTELDEMQNQDSEASKVAIRRRALLKVRHLLSSRPH